LLPKWRNRPAGEISADALLAVLNGKVRAGSPVAANRLRALVSRVFTFAAEQRLVQPTANPVIGVKKPTKEALAQTSSPKSRRTGRIVLIDR